MLSVFTLWAVTVYLASQKKLYMVTLIPALFMTCVTVTYIFFAPEGFSIITSNLLGASIPYEAALGVGIATSGFLLLLFTRWLKGLDAVGIGMQTASGVADDESTEH